MRRPAYGAVNWTWKMSCPSEVRELFERLGYGCLALETDRDIVHVCHASDIDISGFPGSTHHLPLGADQNADSAPHQAGIRHP